MDLDAIENAAKLLAQAKNPLIFVGGGALEAGDEVRELAEALQAPVVAARTGQGILSSRHALSIHMPEAHTLWKQADVVLAIGSRLQVPLQNWGHDASLKLIRIDIDPTEHPRIVPPTVSLVADSQDALRGVDPGGGQAQQCARLAHRRDGGAQGRDGWPHGLFGAADVLSAHHSRRVAG